MISTDGSEISSETTADKILVLLRANPTLSARQLAAQIGVSARAIEKQIAKLRDAKRLERIGAAQAGSWRVV